VNLMGWLFDYLRRHIMKIVYCIKGSSYHIFTELLPGGSLGSLLSPPYAQLDRDEINVFGPEIVTIKTRDPGIYKYGVYLFAGIGSLSTASGVVKVFDVNGDLIRIINAPTIGGGRWWYILDIDGATSNVRVVNTIQANQP
jgi:hypothetical protein